VSGRITVVGLGPAGPELLSAAAAAAIADVPPGRRWLRTSRHPAAIAAGTAQSFDAFYESEATFDDVYGRITGALLDAAADGDVVYAVPGSPYVLERTVALLVDAASAAAVDVRIVPSMSFLDLAWARLGIDPVGEGIRLVDGHRIAEDAAGAAAPMLVAHCHNRRVLSDVKLAFDDGDEPGRAVLLQRLGLPDEHVVEVAWADLDRSVEPDHLTCVFVPASAGARVGAALVRFDELVRTLRTACPWDREQTHESLTRHLVEEAYEVLDAIESGDDAHLEEELGDLLFQVVLHAAIARERGAFTLADVATGIHDKLHARHPHVFGDDVAATAEEVAAGWEARKKAEKGRSSLFDGIPTALPALLYAAKVLRKAATLGVDVEGDVPPDDLGDALLALVSHALAVGVDPEVALRRSADRVRASAEALE
jgi:tetrapyrrole methylase family protein/MazG family protein